MSNTNQLIVAMAERCSDLIRERSKPDLEQPQSLRPRHLEWMCKQIAQHAGEWPDIKSHRWLGFVQGAMIANRIIDLDGAKAMFEEAQRAFGEPDADLLDHLDPDSAFELEIGGQG